MPRDHFEKTKLCLGSYERFVVDHLQGADADVAWEELHAAEDELKIAEELLRYVS